MGSKMRQGVLLLIAAVASLAIAAPASGEEIHSEASHTELKGSQIGEDAMGFAVGALKCIEKNYEGTFPAKTTTTVGLWPIFYECSGFGAPSVVVDTNGCNFQYHVHKTEGEKIASSARMDIACPVGSAIVITTYKCHITIPEQMGLTSVTYVNKGAGNSQDITITHSITGLKYTQTSKLTPGCTNGSFSNGTYSGSTTVKGYDTFGQQVGIGAAPSEDPSSSEGGFHAQATHALSAGEEVGEDTVTFKAGTWTCTQKTYAGTFVASTSLTLTMSPAFAECKAFGFVNAVTHTNGCKIQYQAKKGEVPPPSMNIVCPEGQGIVVTAFNCHITIPSQAGLSSVAYANQGEGKTQDILITHSITGLKYTQAPKSFPGCASGTFTDGTYTGTTTVKGKNTGGEQVGVGVRELIVAGDDFQSEAAHTLWTASQIGEDTYTFVAGTWKCTSKTDAGTSTAAKSTTVNLTPSFSGCTGGTTVDVNGCEYRYHTQKEGVSNKGMSIICPEGKSIVITAATCHLTIPAQVGLTSVAYTSEGAGKSRDVKVTHSITGLKYSQTPQSFPGCAEGSFTNGTYSGSTALKGMNTASEQIGVWVD